MSSKERRKELKLEWEIEQEALEKEAARKEALTLYERIDESDASDDVKDILHRICAALAAPEQDKCE
jgi:hypothetical protein